jgi:drug/metabolite transporter (DMT)-like permease
LYIAFLGTAVPFGLYFVGINYIRSTRASITATLEPISAGFIAYFFLGETLEPFQVLGGILVVTAIVLLQLRGEKDALAPELIRARATQNSNPPPQN